MAISERTASYLAEEVRKAQAELELARTQTREAQAREEAASIKVEALRAAIGPGAPASNTHTETFTLTVPATQRALFGSPPKAFEGKAEPTFGFREAIRLVLGDAHKGLRVAEVHEGVVARGIVYKGKTEPKLRTGNELRRMVREGQARKRGRLYYARLPGAGAVVNQLEGAAS